MTTWQGWWKSKTFWSAVGLVGLAIYQATQGDWALALTTFLAALAALGVRHAVAKAAYELRFGGWRN